MNGPLISVIIVFRDVERFLDEAVGSVLDQDWPHWELILVDDGSADGSTDIARRYAASQPQRIRYLDHPGHAGLGISASRNAGVAAARGEYVAFLDGDDVYLPARLSRHAEALSRRPGVATVQSCLEYWWSWTTLPDGEDDQFERPPMGDRRGLVDPPALLLLLLETANATAAGICSFTMRRDLYLALGGCDESFPRLFEDQVLTAKFYLEHPVYVMPDVLARYRRHAGSLVGRAGEAGLNVARGEYLEWLERYVAARGMCDPRVARAVRRALVEFRHPSLWALRQAPGDALRWLRAVGYAMLPDVVARPVRTAWRRYKQRRTDHLLERARRAVGGPQ
jgi:glycosyltransferase involved in cell wall biosynthesis